MNSLIAVIRQDAEVARFLEWPGDFDLDRGDHVEEVHLESGAALEGFAGHGEQANLRVRRYGGKNIPYAGAAT